MSILGAFFRRSGKQYEAPSNTPDPVAHKYIEPKVVDRGFERVSIGYYPGVPPTAMISFMPMADDPDKPPPMAGYDYYGTAQQPRVAGKLTGITV